MVFSFSRFTVTLAVFDPCLLDVLVWIQAFSKGNHSAIHLGLFHTLELMSGKVTCGDEEEGNKGAD